MFPRHDRLLRFFIFSQYEFILIKIKIFSQSVYADLSNDDPAYSDTDLSNADLSNDDPTHSDADLPNDDPAYSDADLPNDDPAYS